MKRFKLTARGSVWEQAFAHQVAISLLTAPEREFRFDKDRRWRFDFAWPSRLVAVEIEGGQWTRGRHTRGAGFEKDAEKYAAALVKGWRVLRATPGMVRSWEAIRVLRDLLEEHSV